MYLLQNRTHKYSAYIIDRVYVAQEKDIVSVWKKIGIFKAVY